jgi:hypothetical protein
LSGRGARITFGELVSNVDGRHPNDPQEVRRKLAREARTLSPSERRDLRELLDAALARLRRRKKPTGSA